MSAQPCGCDLEAGWLCDQHTALLADTGTSPEPNTERLDGKLPKWERLDRAERFKARLAAADQMTDTTQVDAGEVRLCRDGSLGPPPSALTAAEQFRAEVVAVADAVQTRDDLLNRIATLENQLALAESRETTRAHNLRYLLVMERHDKQQFRERIAAILATFYHAELSISSTQPIIALALELNPDLVERTR